LFRLCAAKSSKCKRTLLDSKASEQQQQQQQAASSKLAAASKAKHSKAQKGRDRSSNPQPSSRRHHDAFDASTPGT
jgi:hypothetical protein